MRSRNKRHGAGRTATPPTISERRSEIHFPSKARAAAKRLDLFILQEPAGWVGHRHKWSVYCGCAGFLILTYWPKSQHYRCGPDQGHVDHWQQVLELAARRRDELQDRKPGRAG